MYTLYLYAYVCREDSQLLPLCPFLSGANAAHLLQCFPANVFPGNDHNVEQFLLHCFTTV